VLYASIHMDITSVMKILSFSLPLGCFKPFQKLSCCVQWGEIISNYMRVNFHVLVNYYFSPLTNTLTLALAPALVSGECQCTSLSVGR